MFNNAIHLNTNATTVVVGVPVELISVVINSKGATGNTLTLYDNATAASGTVIAVIDTTSVIGDIQYNILVKNGITAIMQTGTAGDATICWR